MDLFASLDNLWTFTSVGENETELRFDISFEFASFLHHSVSSAHFDRLAAEMVEAFTARCAKVQRERY